MWEYRASVIDVLDGDTLRLLVDTGFHARHQVDLRLVAVKAPELNQAGGPETKEFVVDWCSKLPPLKWPLLIKTSTTTVTEPSEKMTFTRYLGHAWNIDNDACLNVAINGFLTLHPEWGPGE